jgi:hypothetical protein
MQTLKRVSGLWFMATFDFLLVEKSKYKIYNVDPHVEELEGNIHHGVHST